MGLGANRLDLALEQVQGRLVGGHADRDQGLGGTSVGRGDGGLARRRIQHQAPQRGPGDDPSGQPRHGPELDPGRLRDRLERHDRPEPAPEAHQQRVVCAVVVPLARGAAPTQRGMEAAEQVRPRHPVRDRRHLAAAGADPQLADAPVPVKAGAGHEQRIAGTHREPSRQRALDSGYEPVFISLGASLFLVAGERLHGRRSQNDRGM